MIYSIPFVNELVISHYQQVSHATSNHLSTNASRQIPSQQAPGEDLSLLKWLLQNQ